MAAPLVALVAGALRGRRLRLLDGSEYFSFKGIPYAEPPVGELRFKAPLPLRPWRGTLEAAEHGPVCPQMKPNREILAGSENCLFLNVYTRCLHEEAKLPVMVYIHGGGFISGSGNDDAYGPDFLLAHNVILVTVNYRLEVFGFLCLDTPEVPGNAGLKDQVAALRWVKTNIHNFGGDPGNITIFGESAGGVSVTYHMLSPMAEGLFHKAISQSGVCLHDWAFENDGRARAFKVGRLLGKDTDDAEELLDFLQNVPAKKLIGLNYKVASEDEKHRGLPLRFKPVAEKRFTNVVPFMTETPLHRLLSGGSPPVPFMVGYNSREALVITPRELKKAEFINEHPSFLVPAEIARRVSRDKLEEYGDRIKLFYLRGRDLNSEDVDVVADLLSDLHFTFGIHRMANIYAARCESVYLYRFNLSTEMNISKLATGLFEHHGACHVDELYYIFKNVRTVDLYKKKQVLRDYVHTITKLWTDFAKTGNPTLDGALGVAWAPYSARDRRHLSIDVQLAMAGRAEGERMDFWRKMYGDAGLVTDVDSKL